MSCGFSKVLFSATTGSVWFKRIADGTQGFGVKLKQGSYNREALRIINEEIPFCGGFVSIFYGLRKVLPYNLIWGEELERAVSGVFCELSLQRGVIFCNKSWGSGRSLVGLQRGSQQRGKDPA